MFGRTLNLGCFDWYAAKPDESLQSHCRRHGGNCDGGELDCFLRSLGHELLDRFLEDLDE